MSDPSARTFSADFKRFFLRGLAILLPSVLTLWIVVKAYQFIDSAVAEPINSSVRAGMVSLTPYWAPLQSQFEPNDAEISVALASAGKGTTESMRAKLRSEHIATWWAERWYMDFIGLVIAIVAVYIAGRLLGGFLGRRFYRRIERLITSVPVFKQVYPYVKQVVDFLISDDKQVKFSRVVMAQYPSKGIWSIGFLTGSAMDSVKARAGDSVTVFIPSSPTPFTGYAINVPRSEIVELPITVEEAVRFVVSCGVLVPQHQRPPIVHETLRAIDMTTTEEFAVSVAARVKTTLTHQDLGER
jgi:uncharacterized membrane protein